MKILIITPRFHTNLYFRIKALQEKGLSVQTRHDVSLISFYQGMSECYDILAPIIIGYSRFTILLNKIIGFFKKTYLKCFWELKLSIPNIRKLKRHIREINPDIILLKDFQSLSELVSLYLAKKLNKKVILLIQVRKDTLLGSVFLFKLHLRLLSYLGVVYFVTPTKEGEEILRNSGISAVSYIPFAIEVKDFNKIYIKNNKIRILSVGKFVQRKDYFTLLKAINLLKNKYPIELTLIGERADEEYLQEIRDYIKKEYLESIVTIKFNVDYKESLIEYKNHDLFVLPSYDEPAAYSLVEAMANKLPVICSDDCGTRCYIKEGKNGYIFKNKDSINLVACIEQIIKTKEITKDMGSKSFRYAQVFHSLESFNKKFTKILDKI